MQAQYEVAYNSDLIIRDPSEASTLCVFYDRVYLPYTDPASSRELIGNGRRLEEYANDIADWEVQYGTLFDEGVLQRLPPLDGLRRTGKRALSRWLIELPSEQPYPVLGMVHDGKGYPEPQPSAKCGSDADGPFFEFSSTSINEEEVESHETLVTAWSQWVGRATKRTYKCRLVKAKRFERYEIKHALDIAVDSQISNLLTVHVDKYASGKSPLIRLDLARHLLRRDITVPQIFTLAEGRGAHDVFVALEAKATFRYLLPKVVTFHPTQILELRSKVKDTREGFTMHLWKLSKGLEERASGGGSLADAARFAEDVIRTELMPDYREFKRQLEAMQTAKWGKFLDAAGKIAEIDAAPWTPKFWALVLKAVGVAALRSQTEQIEALSNKYQAYKFMSYVEGSPLSG